MQIHAVHFQSFYMIQKVEFGISGRLTPVVITITIIIL